MSKWRSSTISVERIRPIYGWGDPCCPGVPGGEKTKKGLAAALRPDAKTTSQFRGSQFTWG